jgi:hypothetical protein
MSVKKTVAVKKIGLGDELVYGTNIAKKDVMSNASDTEPTDVARGSIANKMISEGSTVRERDYAKPDSQEYLQLIKSDKTIIYQLTIEVAKVHNVHLGDTVDIIGVFSNAQNRTESSIMHVNRILRDVTILNFKKLDENTLLLSLGLNKKQIGKLLIGSAVSELHVFPVNSNDKAIFESNLKDVMGPYNGVVELRGSDSRERKN